MYFKIDICTCNQTTLNRLMYVKKFNVLVTVVNMLCERIDSVVRVLQGMYTNVFIAIQRDHLNEHIS